MSNPYNTFSDDFGVSMYLASKVPLILGRETMLHFFESIQKLYPRMTEFEKRDESEFVLEEDRESGSYRWASVDNRKLCTGSMNPPDLDELDRYNERVLELAPPHLGVTGLDAEYLDVVYYFDLLYAGNHDEVVAEALGSNGPFEALTRRPGGKVLLFQPAVMIALDDACQLQCRLSVETRTTAYQVRTRNFPDSPVTVYCTLRQFWGKQPFKTFEDAYRNQRRVLDELVTEHVIPNIVQPLSETIGAK